SPPRARRCPWRAGASPGRRRRGCPRARTSSSRRPRPPNRRRRAAAGGRVRSACTFRRRECNTTSESPGRIGDSAAAWDRPPRARAARRQPSREAGDGRTPDRGSLPRTRRTRRRAQSCRASATGVAPRGASTPGANDPRNPSITLPKRATTPHNGGMRCAIGVDLGAATAGALTFARWLAAEGSVWSSELAPEVTLLAIHVLEEKRHAYTPTLADAVRPAIVARLREHGLAEAVQGPFLVFGARSGAVLLQEAIARSAECLIVGRPASPSPTLGRLGPVARHLLRELVMPAVFVPSPMHLGDVAGGPVLLAVDQLQPCTATLAWARRLARHLQRDLLVVHALPQLEDEQPLPHGVS